MLYIVVVDSGMSMRFVQVFCIKSDTVFADTTPEDIVDVGKSPLGVIDFLPLSRTKILLASIHDYRVLQCGAWECVLLRVQNWRLSTFGMGRLGDHIWGLMWRGRCCVLDGLGSSRVVFDTSATLGRPVKWWIIAPQERAERDVP